jgi:hypothetical protein
MKQPRPTQVELIETGPPEYIIDQTDEWPHQRPTVADILPMIRAIAVRSGYGKSDHPAIECDCWMVTYSTGDYEILTIGDAFAGTCRYPGKPVTYVAPMKLVWH